MKPHRNPTIEPWRSTAYSGAEPVRLGRTKQRKRNSLEFDGIERKAGGWRQ